MVLGVLGVCEGVYRPVETLYPIYKIYRFWELVLHCVSQDVVGIYSLGSFIVHLSFWGSHWAVMWGL